MSLRRFGPVFALILFLLLPSHVTAAECRFVLGFKTIRDLIGHDIVGACLEDQHHGANGDGLQHTTGGLLVWRKADNWTAFTDGYRTWVNGPLGLQQRFNTERFDWEIENTIASLPHGPRNPSSVQDLRDIAEVSTPVFLALLQTVRAERLSSSRIRRVLDLTRIDDSIALRLVEMPILISANQYVFLTVFDYAFDLARSDPAALHRILSDPELEGGITDDNVAIFVILALGESRAEAAAAIKSLLWVQDGVGYYPANEPSRIGAIENPEELIFYNLVRMAKNSHQAALTLLDRAWLHDSLNHVEIQVIVRLTMISDNSAQSALQLVGMPFLKTLDINDQRTVYALFELLLYVEDGILRLFAHPDLVGGITDSHHEFVQSLARSMQNQ